MKKFLVILMVVVMASFLLVGCLPTTNTGPVFTSTPGTTATVGTAYSYTPTATDADADTVTFSVSGPIGMAISGAVISWTPTTAQIGTHSVVVTASDGTNATAQTATITVSAAAVTGTPISIVAIGGVTAPVYGVAPDLTVAATTQYTGVTTWATAAGVAAGSTFAADTVYVATITLTAATGFTATGVAANFFTVAGAAGQSNVANSAVVYATFPITGPGAGTVVVTTAAITGVTLPATGVAPVTAITAATQYTGTVTWKTLAGVVPTTFAAGTVYIATITLTPAAGYTFTGVAANYFTVASSTTDTNPADSGVVTVVFPATYSTPTVVSAKFVDSDTITIVYSEKVLSPTADRLIDYTNMEVTYPHTAVLTPTIVYGTGTATITIDFTGYTANGLTEGTVDIGVGIVGASGGLPIVAVTKVIAAGSF